MIRQQRVALKRKEVVKWPSGRVVKSQNQAKDEVAAATEGLGIL